MTVAEREVGHPQRFKEVDTENDNDNFWSSLDETIIFYSLFDLISNPPQAGFDKIETRIVALKRYDDMDYLSVQRDTIEQKHKSVRFPVNLANGHMVIESVT